MLHCLDSNWTSIETRPLPSVAHSLAHQSILEPWEIQALHCAAVEKHSDSTSCSVKGKVRCKHSGTQLPKKEETISNKCIATSKKCLTSRNKKLVETSASEGRQYSNRKHFCWLTVEHKTWSGHSYSQQPFEHRTLAEQGRVSAPFPPGTWRSYYKLFKKNVNVELQSLTFRSKMKRTNIMEKDPVLSLFPLVAQRGGERLGKETTLRLFRQQKPGRESQHAMAKGKGECQQRPPNTTPANTWQHTTTPATAAAAGVASKQQQQQQPQQQ